MRSTNSNFNSAKYNRTERLCIFFQDGSGLLRKFNTLHVLLFKFLFTDATIRPVLKHGPRSSTALRVVEFNTKLNFIITRQSESKVVRCNFFYSSTGCL